MSATRSASSTSTPLAQRQRFTKFYAEDIPAAGPRLRSRSTPQLAARLRKAGLAHTYQVLQGSGAAASAAATVVDTKFRVGIIRGGTSTATWFGQGDLDIFKYDDTTRPRTFQGKSMSVAARPPRRATLAAGRRPS